MGFFFMGLKLWALLRSITFSFSELYFLHKNVIFFTIRSLLVKTPNCSAQEEYWFELNPIEVL